MVRSWCSLSVLHVDGVDQFEGRKAVPRVHRERRPVAEGGAEVAVEGGVVAGNKRDIVGMRVRAETRRGVRVSEARIAGEGAAGELRLLRVEAPGDEPRARPE